jgi:hypothetical protein
MSIHEGPGYPDGRNRWPIYFNDAVLPGPGQLETSVDGGVRLVIMPPGNTYCVTAENDGISCETVKFKFDAADAVEHGVELHIDSSSRSGRS